MWKQKELKFFLYIRCVDCFLYRMRLNKKRKTKCRCQNFALILLPCCYFITLFVIDLGFSVCVSDVNGNWENRSTLCFRFPGDFLKTAPLAYYCSYLFAHKQYQTNPSRQQTNAANGCEKRHKPSLLSNSLLEFYITFCNLIFIVISLVYIQIHIYSISFIDIQYVTRQFITLMMINLSALFVLMYICTYE